MSKKARVPWCYAPMTMGDHANYVCTRDEGHDGEHGTLDEVDPQLEWNSETQGFDYVRHHLRIIWTTEAVPRPDEVMSENTA